ncbi:MAG: flippase activity-associated protein Agl23, partial [Thermomicrobiales bacterium]
MDSTADRSSAGSGMPGNGGNRLPVSTRQTLASPDGLPGDSVALSGFTPYGSSPPIASGLAERLPASISFESFAHILLVLAAMVSRFWDLGSKTLHHDESLHTYYSWELATGRGYVHDPLMHGPFLFHANALVYWLFGATDATSRYMPALFGVLLVALPWLLRGPQFLGRWGALAAAAFLLISPSILYQSRYIRHDIYTIAGTLLLFICIVRFVDERRRRWLVIGAATIAFLLTNHEIIFAVLAIFGGYLYSTLFVEYFRAWRTHAPRLAWSLVGIHLLMLFASVALFLATGSSTKNELLDIPWNNPTRDQERDYYEKVLTNPLVLGYVVLFALFCAALVLLVMEARKIVPALDCGASCHPEVREATVSRAVRSAIRDGAGLLIALAAGLAIFVPLYTSLFQNMNGLRTSTVATDGTLLYWLGQHDVQRGEQPWFYFLLLLPQYEFLAVVLGGFMLGAIAIQVIRALLGREHGRNLFFRLFVAVWFVLIFAGLSYGGEKMPWLVVHIALPGILLAAMTAGTAKERAERLPRLPGMLPRAPVFLHAERVLTVLLLLVGG